MIARPVNDAACLGQLAAVAVEMRHEGTAIELARRLRSIRTLAAWLRTLPQRDDDGSPTTDGVACDTWQRLRRWPADPNCFERAAMFLAVADLLAPSERWTVGTFTTAHGRHTAPLRLFPDGRGGFDVELFDLTPARHAVRNDIDPDAQEAFGVVHTVGGAVLGIFGLGGLSAPLSDLERDAGLLKRRQEKAPQKQPPSAKRKEGTNGTRKAKARKQLPRERKR